MLQSFPLVSVITPLYNYAEYVDWAITSVWKQSWPNFEHILVDDGSTDKSVEVVKARLSDPRTRLIELKQNRGYSTAKNIGIKAARGTYITAIDADDMLTRNSLEVRVNFLQHHPEYTAVHGRVYSCFGAGDFTDHTHDLPEEPSGGEVVREYMRNRAPERDYWQTINAQGMLCHRSVYERVGLYDQEMRWKADREMWHRMLYNGCHVGYVPEYVAIYRHHGKNMSQSEERRKSNIEQVFTDKCRKRNGETTLEDVERLEPLAG